MKPDRYDMTVDLTCTLGGQTLISESKLGRFGPLLLCAMLIAAMHDVNAKNAVDKRTKHFVAFKYKAEVDPAQKKSVREAFLLLKRKIPFVVSIEWGPNTSPENLNKGMDDGFLLTFKSSKDRDQYLTHPEHEAFKKIALPLVADAFVFDFEDSQNHAGARRD